MYILNTYGWGDDQWFALEQLWTRESGWNHLAVNPSSGATGIPQSLPGDKMATAGADWKTNPKRRSAGAPPHQGPLRRSIGRLGSLHEEELVLIRSTRARA